MTVPIKSPRKLIEVALPLDAINEAAAKEKSIRHGHPSTFHLWWARRPLAATRAVIFAQMVNDPAGLWEVRNPGLHPNTQQRGAFTKRRKELFDLIKALVKWENTTNEEVLNTARSEIRRSWREVCELNKDHPLATSLFDPEIPPALHDPFAGGGAIPLEAQRLGLVSYASDLNPVAVLINKAMIETPSRFANRPPVNPAPDKIEGNSGSWTGAAGLAEDIRFYGAWMREEAEKRIGYLYPKVKVVCEKDGVYRHATDKEIQQSAKSPNKNQVQELTVIAWLWARTVKSPNPAFSHVDVPLVSTFVLSSKEGKEAYVKPIIQGNTYRFTIKMGIPPPDADSGTKGQGRGADFYCLLSHVPISGDYIKAEGQAGRIGTRLLAIVADGPKKRIYLEPTVQLEAIARSASPTWKPPGEVPARLTGGTCVPYGLTEWGDLFTPRQLVALTTFCDLIGEAHERIRQDALAANFSSDPCCFDEGGSGALAYSDALTIILGLAISRSANSINSLVVWSQSREQSVNLFSRQAIPMAWDFPEVTPFSGAAGDFQVTTTSMARCIDNAPRNPATAFVTQADAQRQTISSGKLISTDPPYFDNIAYADLSDFFYVWLRHALSPIFPTLFTTITTPKAEELVATPYRHGDKNDAEKFFLEGMTSALRSLSNQAHPEPPLTIYYAFKQSDTDNEAGTSSSGWETFLQALFTANLSLVGTWPLRTERPTGVKVHTNSLASSIVLVCRKRSDTAPTVSRREFIRELNLALPVALDEMTRGSGEERSPVAPVDLSQAIIGPGMSIFSKYSAVLEADGSPMSVKTALQLINRFLAEDDFDPDTQFCLHWFEQYGWKDGPYGEADTLARAKGTSAAGVAEAGVAESGGGIVRLRKWPEYPTDWDPKTDKRNPIWETLHQLIRTLRQNGETQAGQLLARVRKQTEACRQLAYRLYTLCERQGWAEDARAYNELVTSWSSIESAAGAVPVETDLFGEPI